MANKRFLPCGKKEVFAIGAENSLADLKEKINFCLSCADFYFCQESQKNFRFIIQQQNNLAALVNIEKLKK